MSAPVLRRGDELAPGLCVVEHLARGDALDVYDVFDRRRWTSVVAKTVRPDRTDDRIAIERLEAEGRLLAELAHPHLPRAYETLAGPPPIVVLETLPGQTLKVLLEDRPVGLAADELRLLALQVGSAVRYLHAAGVLHLDLKPSNVIVEAGRARLIDLSIARAPGPARRGLGTPDYMSPEQARGGALSGAADVWGLGMTLFEAATGRLPFPEGPEDAFPQLSERAPAVGGLADLPAKLATSIDRCLDPEPDRRPGIDELLRALDPDPLDPCCAYDWADDAAPEPSAIGGSAAP